ncbi:MAG: hypothetical protein IKS41_06040 [Alphaproteobacteria bacterium]|nr:hypothetical protein [Alphaproteobacteria bacterium]
MRKIIGLCVVAGMFTSNTILTTPVLAAVEAPLTMSQIYNYAKNGNVRALKSLGKKVDSIGRDGNTNLCRAVYNNDYKSFNALRVAGANVKHPCTQKIPPEQIKAFNEGYTAWAQEMNAAAGATAASGGAVATETGLSTAAMVGIGVGAVAVIGGGIALAAGGGGGGGSKKKEKKCAYGKDANGDCLPPEPVCESGIFDDNGNCVTGDVNNKQIVIVNDNDDDVYGMSNSKNKTMYNAYAYMDQSDASSINIDITNTGNGDVYGMSGQSYMYNAYTYDESCNGAEYAYGNILIKNTGDGNVYGMHGEETSPEIYNGYICDNCPGGGSFGTIRITNKGTGKVYGMWGNTVYNALATGKRVSDSSPISGDIEIINNLDTDLNNVSDAYGIYGNGDIYNAYQTGTLDSSYEGLLATGNISVTNETNGNSYGMYNESDGITSNENGDVYQSTITIVSNGDGKAYGLYSNGGTIINSGKIDVTAKGPEAYGIYGTTGSHITNSGTISVAGLGDLYGIFGENNVLVENSGEIEITGQNIANKKAYGIKVGDNSTVKNRGLITISDTDEDKSYGIDMGSGSTLINAGRIVVNDNVESDYAACEVNNYYDGTSCTPCQNGGTSDGGTSLSCSCSGNWGGDDCGTCKLSGDHVDSTSCDCTGGYIPSGNVCVLNCNENEYLNGTTCQACQNGGTSEGGTVQACSCSGNWKGNDCGTCGLSGSNVDEATCSCAAGYVPSNGVCVNSAWTGPLSGKNWANLPTGVRVLWKDKGVSAGQTYTNTTNQVIDDTSKLQKANLSQINPPSSFNENNYEILWLAKHIKDFGEPDDTIDWEYRPVLYAGNPGLSGGKTTLKNSATVKVKNPDDDFDVDEVYVYGANFENSGTIGSSSGYTYQPASVIGISVGAPIWVKNEGHIYGEVTLYGFDGQITFSNKASASVEDVSAFGNIVGVNEGTVGSVQLDGSAYFTNKGSINDGVTLFKGTLINEGTISEGVMVLGPSKLVNEKTGTINGDIEEWRHFFVPTVDSKTYTVTYKDMGATRANLEFVNKGTFNGVHRVLSKASDFAQLGGMSDIGSMNMKNSGNVNFDTELDLDALAGRNGKIMLLNGGSFSADSIKGKLYVDGETSGFEQVYTLSDAIIAQDASELNLISESAMFDASLADNGKDVVMTMRGFDTATKNASLAEFLTRNYASGKNEAFFNKLKSFGDVHSLTSSLDKMTGKEMLSRFNFEDMTMMRELNFDMNEKLFHNKEKAFALAGSVRPMAFRGDNGSDARYSLYNKRDGRWSVGLGVAFMNTRSDNAHDDDDRHDSMYQLVVPIGYRTHGFNLMTSPRIGYARGKYDRTGFDNKNYDGTIEKRVYGLMNEARYPLTFGEWTLEPAAEFNILGYTQRGHEEDKDYALNIKSQNTYSVEGGIGLYLTKDKELTKTSKIKLTAGVAAYHEFADPYKLRVGMEGMDGTFMLRDEKRSDNRGVIRAGFDYDWSDYSLYGSIMSYIDKEVRTSLKSGFKWKF